MSCVFLSKGFQVLRLQSTSITCTCIFIRRVVCFVFTTVSRTESYLYKKNFFVWKVKKKRSKKKKNLFGVKEENEEKLFFAGSPLFKHFQRLFNLFSQH